MDAIYKLTEDEYHDYNTLKDNFNEAVKEEAKLNKIALYFLLGVFLIAILYFGYNLYNPCICDNINTIPNMIPPP